MLLAVLAVIVLHGGIGTVPLGFVKKKTISTQRCKRDKNREGGWEITLTLICLWHFQLMGKPVISTREAPFSTIYKPAKTC